MIRDTTLLGNIQMAMIGIVLVAGLFYVWRSICRLEEKVDRLMTSMATPSKMCSSPSGSCPLPDTIKFGDSDAAAEAFMKQVFGGDDDFMVFSSMPTDSEKSGVHVEEVATPVEEAPSETDTDHSNPLSKSKLRSMNLAALKTLCKERGLSEEGSKNVLVDRLLGLTRD